MESLREFVEALALFNQRVRALLQELRRERDQLLTRKTEGGNQHVVALVQEDMIEGAIFPIR